MAADYAKPKLDIVSRLKNATTTLLDTVNLVQLLQQEATDAGFAPGGANVLADAGLATAYPSLTAADIANAFTVFSALNTTLAANSRAGYKALTRVKES